MRTFLAILAFLLMPVSPAAARGVVPIYLLETQPDGSVLGVRGATVTVLGGALLRGVTDDSGMLCAQYDGRHESVQVTISHPDFKPINNRQVYVYAGSECDPGVIQSSAIYVERKANARDSPALPPTPKPRAERRFDGIARDQQGHGLSDVEVSTFNNCLPGTSTTSNGFFSLRANSGCEAPIELTIELKKIGFRPKTVSIYLSDQPRQAEPIVLDTTWKPSKVSGGDSGFGSRSTSVQTTMAIGMGVAALVSGGAGLVFWRLREGKADDFNGRSDCDATLANRGAAGCRALFESGDTAQQWMTLSFLGAGGFALAAVYFLWFAPRPDLGTYSAASCRPGALATTLTCRIAF